MKIPQPSNPFDFFFHLSELNKSCILHQGWLMKSSPVQRQLNNQHQLVTRNWHRRYFVLYETSKEQRFSRATNGLLGGDSVKEEVCEVNKSGEDQGVYLLYYTDHKLSRLKGVIDLSQIIQIDVDLALKRESGDNEDEENSSEIENIFCLKSESRVYYLAPSYSTSASSQVTKYDVTSSNEDCPLFKQKECSETGKKQQSSTLSDEMKTWSCLICNACGFFTPPVSKDNEAVPIDSKVEKEAVVTIRNDSSEFKIHRRANKFTDNCEDYKVRPNFSSDNCKDDIYGFTIAELNPSPPTTTRITSSIININTPITSNNTTPSTSCSSVALCSLSSSSSNTATSSSSSSETSEIENCPTFTTKMTQDNELHRKALLIPDLLNVKERDTSLKVLPLPCDKVLSPNPYIQLSTCFTGGKPPKAAAVASSKKKKRQGEEKRQIGLQNAVMHSRSSSCVLLGSSSNSAQRTCDKLNLSADNTSDVRGRVTPPDRPPKPVHLVAAPPHDNVNPPSTDFVGGRNRMPRPPPLRNLIKTLPTATRPSQSGLPYSPSSHIKWRLQKTTITDRKNISQMKHMHENDSDLPILTRDGSDGTKSVSRKEEEIFFYMPPVNGGASESRRRRVPSATTKNCPETGSGAHSNSASFVPPRLPPLIIPVRDAALSDNISYIDLDLREQLVVAAVSKDGLANGHLKDPDALGDLQQTSTGDAMKNPQRNVVGVPPTTVYKSIDFVKTEAFNRTREMMNHQKLPARVATASTNGTPDFRTLVAQ